jgi:type I restriction enzyme S subunit
MTINPQLMIFKAIQCNKKFLFYYVSSTVIQDVIPLHNTGSTIPTMTQAGIGKLPFPLPSTEEQTAIADFLDRETGRIDTLVAKKRRLIALLGEKRTALISRTVTRGLPAEAAREFDLEPHTRFKDSGIGWLGEVPEGWEVCALKRITISRCDGPFGSGLKSEHYCDVGVRVIRLQNIRLGQFDNRDSAFIDPEYYRQLGDHTVIPGDVLIAGLGDENNPIGRACVAPCGIGPAMVKADCFRFRLKLTHAIPTYIALQLSISANSLGGALATGTTRGRMNLSTTENRKIALPPLPEQTAIAAYLDRETATIDQLVTKVEAAIVRLLEYRTALITAAVTGKIDVRGKAGLDTD